MLDFPWVKATTAFVDAPDAPVGCYTGPMLTYIVYNANRLSEREAQNLAVWHKKSPYMFILPPPAFQTAFKDIEDGNATNIIRVFPVKEEDWDWLEQSDIIDAKRFNVLFCNSVKTDPKRYMELCSKPITTPEQIAEYYRVTPLSFTGEEFAYIFLDKDVSDGKIPVSKEEMPIVFVN